MSNNENIFTVPNTYIEHDKEKFELELKEISFLLFQIYKFHENGHNNFNIPLFPYNLIFLKSNSHPWLLISCKVEPPENKKKATFSFAASTDGQSFQNCSGLIDNINITPSSLNLWLQENQGFLSLLRQKKESYKNNFFTTTDK